MSTNNEYQWSFPNILKILSRYFLPILFIIGNFSCFLSLFILLKKTIRRNSSGLYFLALTFSNWIFINLVIPDTFLYFGFNIDPTLKNLNFCRFHFYVGFVTSALSSNYLVLASIDRYIITTSNDWIRRFNRRTIAKKFILIVTIFWLIFHLHPFFLLIDPKSTTNRFSCVVKSKIYSLIIVWYELIIFGFITPLLWIFFGIRTIQNVRRVLVSPLSRLYAIDRQLIIIMLSQCSIFVLFRLPLPISLIYTYFTKRSTNDEQHRSIEMILFFITLISFYTPFCTFFFVNLISNSFRNEFKRTVENLLRRYICQKKKSKRRTKNHRNIRVFPMEIIQQK